MKKKGHPSSVILGDFFPRNILFTDGMDGWDGMGWGIKSVLQCSLYFLGTYNEYVYKYIYTFSIYPQSMENIEGHFCYLIHPIHP